MSLWGYTTKPRSDRHGLVPVHGPDRADAGHRWPTCSSTPRQLQFVISVLGVLIFTGLTAYDSQSIKNMYYVGDDGEVVGKKAIMGALRLYLDFINLFLFLLRFMGNRR